MHKAEQKVLITTSGTGSRLGDLTKNTNKSLININGRSAISYIFDSYPKDTEFIITLGYLGSLVKEELSRKFPDLNLSYVWVDKFVGPGSSLGYSMLAAKDHLQSPFIFNCCDTLFEGNLPSLGSNWIGGYEKENNGQYRTLKIENHLVTNISDKDNPASKYIHIGLVGIHDYGCFWKSLQKAYELDPNDQTLNDTSAINLMLKSGCRFSFKEISEWFDTGNPQSLERTKKLLAEK